MLLASRGAHVSVARIGLRKRHSTAKKVKEDLRRLLRETAQPVAVVTSHYPLDGANDPEGHKFHGATLSSFTSIALEPHPLVSFSLRIPSRMATSLRQLMKSSGPQERSSPKNTAPDLVINILSNSQADVAHHFSRADLFPDPFRITPHRLTEDGLPVLSGSLGALSCNLVSHVTLKDLVEDKENDECPSPKGDFVSELFISRVVRVESEISGVLPREENALPLLYHRRKYATTHLLDKIH